MCMNIDKNPQHEPKRHVRDLKRYYQAYKEYQHTPEHFNGCYSLPTISADNPMLYSYQYFLVAIRMLKNLRLHKSHLMIQKTIFILYGGTFARKSYKVLLTRLNMLKNR